MADHYLDSVFHLSGIPGLTLRGINARAQNSGVDSLVAQNSLQPGCDFVLLRVHDEDLAPPSVRQFLPDLFDQPAFFGIDSVLWKVTGFRNDKFHSVFEFRIELRTIQRPNSEWVIGIEQ